MEGRHLYFKQTFSNSAPRPRDHKLSIHSSVSRGRSASGLKTYALVARIVFLWNLSWIKRKRNKPDTHITTMHTIFSKHPKTESEDDSCTGWWSHLVCSFSHFMMLMPITNKDYQSSSTLRTSSCEPRPPSHASDVFRFGNMDALKNLWFMFFCVSPCKLSRCTSEQNQGLQHQVDYFHFPYLAILSRSVHYYDRG